MRSIDPKRTSRRTAATMCVLAAAVTVLAAACTSATSGPGSGSGSASGSNRSHHAMSSHSPMIHQAATFGPDCGMIPASGMGSLHGMSMDPVVTALSHNPLLATLATYIKAAGVTGDLNSMHALTVFAPSDTAFKMLRSSQMTMLHSKADLARIIKYDIVSGRVTPAELARGMTLKTQEGDTIKPAKMGSAYEVNNAHIICGNIQTANATVYIIDKVLIPMH